MAIDVISKLSSSVLVAALQQTALEQYVVSLDVAAKWSVGIGSNAGRLDLAMAP